MKNTAKQLSIILLGVLLLALAVLPVSAQGSPVTASVDRTSLSTDETLTLSVIVDSSAGQPGQPVLPADGFEVVGTSSGRQLNMVNGATTAQSITQYRLLPCAPVTWPSARFRWRWAAKTSPPSRSR